MVSLSFYLDGRNIKFSAPQTLKLCLSHKGTRAYVPFPIKLFPEDWDKLRQRVKKSHPKAQYLNMILSERMLEAEKFIHDNSVSGEFDGCTIWDMRDMLYNYMHMEPTIEERSPREWGGGTGFWSYFDRFMRSKNKGTRNIYEGTRRRLISYLGEYRAQQLTFEDITPNFLRDFDSWLMQTAPSANARAIHFRNIRAVFNDTIANDVPLRYPFKAFKIRTEPTRKRALKPQQWKKLMELDIEPWEERYRDCFKLIFLMRGINIVDLCNNIEIDDGCIKYRRQKTHAWLEIKLEPEIEALLKKYKGKEKLLNYLDDCKNYRHFYNHLSHALNRFGERIGVKGLSTYWARHTWATFASNLDIPKETIAKGLGHAGNSVTDIYIDFDLSKVDRANRKVIDYVNGL